ncbi:MAG TPA: S9 family peptidase [Methanothrix sp.]|nr:S9 family peptidase [Methanothrix sp.]
MGDERSAGEAEITRIFIVILLFAILMMSGCISKQSEVKTQRNDDAGGLIPRSSIFGNPDHTSVALSPDGSKLSFLAPRNGVLNVWVGPAKRPDEARPVTNDTYRGIRTYIWSFTNDHIIYLQDKNGDENWSIYCVNLTSGTVKNLTPFEGVQAQIVTSSRKYPQEIIIGLNKRDPSYHDLYRLNIETGNMTLLLENREFAGFDVDDDFHVRLATKMTPDGGIEIFRPAGEGWQSFIKVGREDALTTGTLGFNEANDVIYMMDSRGRNTAALYALNLSTGKASLIAEDPKADFGGYMIQPLHRMVQAVAFTYERLNWTVIDQAIAPDLKYLRALEDGDLEVVSRTLDDSAWIVAYIMDNGPVRYYYYDRNKKEAKFLFTDRKSLENLSLAKMNPVVIKARDGLDLVSYYTLPVGSDRGDKKPEKPLPMVLFVHGGPWARDIWGYSSIHQWLANRGYAVLSVNFRGSTGFGKNFTNAGDLEWGRKMQDDLLDAVNWSIREGIADPKRVAIMGGSYGGYATLAGLTFSPAVFACGVDIVGPSNLTSLLESIPAYWKPEVETFITRVGDFRTADGRKLLEERSPLNYVENIRKPLLIGQGANDPRVKRNESDQIVQVMEQRNLSVVYVLYPDEGHGFARPENKLSFYAVSEAFLSKDLGGRYEPIGDDFNGSTIEVLEGADVVPGLEDALKAKKSTK